MKTKKILIVDDEPDVTLAFNMLLRREGFEVDTLNDPVLALSESHQTIMMLHFLISKCQKWMVSPCMRK
ncbi:MAG: hypothetical protein M3M88_00465 [Thermoproteota archaeon]|nr:hypothetical protein [Thermoproteota archaeon]